MKKPVKRTAPAPTQFQLSRIYAQGWAAAGKLSVRDGALLETKGVAALNPYAQDPERARWAEGFGGARSGESRLQFRSAAMSGKPKPKSKPS